MTDANQIPPLTRLRPLRMGDAAPGFQARTTLGEVRLSDYRGKWLVLFSHPADFTPVCTSEFVALAKASEAFGALDCELLGVSVDSLYSHLAWVRAIREKFAITIPFPIIEDPSMAIGRAYGMIDPEATDSSAIRATYFIDPSGLIRAMTWYPQNVGRSVAEMLRMVAALKRTTADEVLTPEGWCPGDDLLLPPLQNQESVVGVDDEHWFYRIQKESK